MFETKSEYVFSYVEATAFRKRFNDLIFEYGYVSVKDLFANPTLLGLVRSDQDEEYLKDTYYDFGWNYEITETGMFDVRENKYTKTYVYVLKMPKACVLPD